MSVRPGMVWYSKQAEWMERGNGVRSRPLCGPEVDTQTMLAGMTEVPVGGEIPLHHHNTDEFILVLRGEALVTIDSEVKPVSAADATLVHAGVKHRYVNTGLEPLRILWVYGDINTTRTIAGTGVTLGHLDPYSPS